jgi:hypothetical protein
MTTAIDDYICPRPDPGATHMPAPQPLAGTVGSVEPLTDRVRIQVDATPHAFGTCPFLSDLDLRPGAGVSPSAQPTDDLKNSALAHLSATSLPRTRPSS